MRRGALAGLAAALVLVAAGVGLEWRLRLLQRWAAAGAPGSVAAMQAADRSDLFGHLPVDGDSIVLLGDSLIREGEWHEWLGPRARNRGMGGERIETLVARLPSSLRVCPARVVLLVGINDLLGLAASDTTVAERLARLAALAAAHDGAARAIRERCPASRLLVLALLPVHCARVTDRLGRPCPDWLPAAIEALNTRLAEQARARGEGYLDAGVRLRDGSGRLDVRFSEDGIHLRGAGYAL